MRRKFIKLLEEILECINKDEDKYQQKIMYLEQMI